MTPGKTGHPTGLVRQDDGWTSRDRFCHHDGHRINGGGVFHLTFHERAMILQSALGLLAITVFALLLGWREAEVPWAERPRVAAVGLGVQFLLALTFLKLPGFRQVFVWLGDAVAALAADETFV